MKRRDLAVALLGAPLLWNAPALAQVADAVENGGADESFARDAETRAKARRLIDGAIEYLRARQNPDTGGWSENPDGPSYPAITGLILDGMLLDPRIDASDPAVAAGVRNILSYAKPDGGIHDGLLPTYNTAICLSALSRVHRPEAAAAVRDGQAFLKTLQYSATGGGEAGGEPVAEDHPYYGGVGYGRHGRPDLSNLGFFLQALHDTGLSTDPRVPHGGKFVKTQ